MVEHGDANVKHVSPMTVASNQDASVTIGDRSVWLAFFVPPDIAQSLALPNGVSADELHLTIAYFGEPGAIADIDKLITAIKDFCDEAPSIDGRISGVGRFNASGFSNNQDVIYASFDSPVLNYFREELLEICEKYKLFADTTFAYTPHITLAYVNPGSTSNVSVPSQEIVFNQVAFVIGGDRYLFDLGRSIPPQSEIVFDSFHYDAGEILNIEQHPDGYLTVRGIATRAGVFPYLNQDGSLRSELRHPKDILNPLSLRTLGPVPVTLEHPLEKVTPQNVHKYQVGSVTNRLIERDGGDLPLVEVVLNIHRKDAIDAVLSKKKIGLSPGYEVKLIQEAGEYKGQSYQYRQVNPVYNHLAICENPRAGAVASLKVDSNNVVYAIPIMSKKIKLTDGAEFEVPEAVAVAFENLQAAGNRNDSAELEKRTREFQSRMDAILDEKKAIESNLISRDSTIAQLQLRVDSLDLELRNERASKTSIIDEEVASRVDAFTKARPYLPQNMRENLDPKMSATDIKRVAVETQNPQLKLDSADPKEIEGAFKMLLASSPRQDSTKPLRQRLGQLRQDAVVPSDPEAARDRAAKKASEAWKVTN